MTKHSVWEGFEIFVDEDGSFTAKVPSLNGSLTSRTLKRKSLDALKKALVPDVAERKAIYDTGYSVGFEVVTVTHRAKDGYTGKRFVAKECGRQALREDSLYEFDEGVVAELEAIEREYKQSVFLFKTRHRAALARAVRFKGLGKTTQKGGKGADD